MPTLACRRCFCTASQALRQPASQSQAGLHPVLAAKLEAILPQEVRDGPVIPPLKHVAPHLRALMQKPMQYAAVRSGIAHPGASAASRRLSPRTAADRQLLRFFASSAKDDVFGPSTASSSGTSSTKRTSSFSELLSPMAPPGANRSVLQSPASPPALPTETRTVEIAPLQDPLLGFLTNLMMKDGKKARARRHVSDLLSTLRQRSGQLPLPMLREAIRLAAPTVRITRHKRAGKSTEVPIALGERQSVHKAIEWILDASDKRKNPNAGGSKRFGERVALEIESVLQGTSEVIKKKESLHVQATINRSNIVQGNQR